MLAAGDVAATRVAADELARVAAELNQPYLHALTAYTTGVVLLAEDEPDRALAALRRAWTGWCDLDAPYEAARARVHIGLACRALGDTDGAELEWSAARSAFSTLGAGPDLARVETLTGAAHRPGAAAGLTARELEVLAFVATGRTNRQIATRLVISEKTVASHLNHIFTKLGLGSRAAVTGYAYEHGLARPGAPE